MERVSEHFTELEMRCPTTRDYRFAAGFIDRLEQLRNSYGPMRISSGARSNVHNRRIGGHPRSLHVYDTPHHDTGGCCAVDVAIANRTKRGNFVADAWNLGFSVGIGHSFVHIDDRHRVLGLEQTMYTYSR